MGRGTGNAVDAVVTWVNQKGRSYLSLLVNRSHVHSGEALCGDQGVCQIKQARTQSHATIEASKRSGYWSLVPIFSGSWQMSQSDY